VDLTALTTLIVEKFKDAGGYSELNDQQLFNAIYKYLDAIYRKYFQIAQGKIEKRELDGIPPNQAEYKKEYELVEDLVMVYANKIAAVTKGEI
jgi:hypothetical protein